MPKSSLPSYTVLLLTLILLTGHGRAQSTYRFDQVSGEEGLPQSIAYQLAQDSDGNLWVTTEEGVVRYNSHETYIYTAASGLPDNFGESVRAVHVGPTGTVWVGGERGIARFQPALDRFETVDQLETGPMLIKDLETGPDGTVWIAGYNGLWKYDPKSAKTSRVAQIRSTETLLLWGETLLCGAAGGLFSIDSGTGDWSATDVKEPILSLAQAGGGVVFGTQNGELYRMDEDLKNARLEATFGRSSIRSIEPKPGGGLYIGTDGSGVHVLDEAYREQDAYRNDVDDLTSISSDGVYDLLTDREGILWVATYGGGVNKLNPYGNAFRHLTHVPNLNNSLRHPFTRALLEDSEGYIWFGTKDGISRWGRTDNTWEHLLTNANGQDRKIVVSLNEQGQYVYAATFQGELFRISKRDFTVRSIIFLNDADKAKGRIFSSLIDEAGDIWVGGINMDLYRISEEDIAAYPVGQVKAMAATPSGGVFLAGREGLKAIKAEEGAAAGAKIEMIKAVQAARATAEFATVNALLWTKTYDKLYLATTGAGLMILDPSKDLVSVINTKNGLPSNTVHSVLIAADESLWVGTTRGLARINFSQSDGRPDTLIQVLTEADGLLSTELNYGSALNLRDGTILMGGPNGVNLFDPDGLVPANAAPNVVLEGFSLFNERQNPGTDALPAHLNSLDELRLDYDQNALTLHFAGVAHAAAEKVAYRWKMVGLNDRWSKADNLPQINFTNLEPGEYNFQVQAATRMGDWGPVKELPITISPPWWETWWARLIYLVLALVAGYVLFRISRAQIRRRNAERQIDFFNNITHELKTPLAILLASLEDVTETAGAAAGETNRKIRSTVKRLNALFEQLLNFHKASSTGKSRHVSAFVPGDRLRELSERFTPLLQERELDLSLKVGAAPGKFHYDTDIFDKIVFNLVSNAVKYSRAGGSIRLDLTQSSQKQLTLTVADTGIGIPADQQKYILREYYRARNAINSQLPGTGLGLMMVKSMVEKEGGSIRFTSEENVGTTFTVEMEDREEDLPTIIASSAASAPRPSTGLANGQPVAAPDLLAEEDSGLEAAQILLVEDNDELRAALAKRLSNHFRVITASNGKAGLEKAAELFPDLLITDLIMPEMDGMELSRAIQADIQLNHIPIFMLTLLHNSDQKVASIEAGVTEYLEKPVNFDLLFAKISNTLSWRKRMRERYAAQDEADRADLHRTDREAEFIGGLEGFMLENIANDSLSVQDLCKHIGMSRTSLYMKMKNLIDFSPQDFIIHTRLKEARRLLTETDDTVKGVAYSCGFSNPKYFSTSFKKKYGMSPVAFRKSLVQ